MSHMARIQLEVKDLSAMERACKRLGFKLIRGQKTYAWYGKFMNDTELPDGLDVTKLGTCEHAISVPGAKYEVGLIKARSGSGYELIWDYWCDGGLVPKIGKDAGKLKQAYTIEKAKMECIRKGYSVREKNIDGKIQLIAEVRR